MDTSDVDYILPKDRIAQEPIRPREQAKLMTLDRLTGEIHHRHVYNFPSLLNPTDVLVLNNTKVFHARLRFGNKELFLVRPSDNGWIAIGKPGKAFSPGTVIPIAEQFVGRVVEKHTDGSFIISFPYSADEVIKKANRYGSVPIPPYIKHIPNPGEYQTAFAKVTGSVAAPTAGFHITNTILEQIQSKGVTIVELTLHVGLGTFLPIKTSIEDHVMHSEWVHLSKETAEQITKAKAAKRRIIAVGTTTTRALEGLPALEAYSGDVQLFIKPGFEFKIVDGLLTNFHLPKSTLLLLVSAFAGTEVINNAYSQAINNNYRFYSFGDAMFIT